MDQKPLNPYVPASTDMAELTVKAVVLGVLMAVVLGAANAYLGMKAGLTVAATFPAAVVAMAALRPFKGTILEENIARTTASVGEALVAGAIFTIPAFVISGAWEELRYWQSTAIMMIGGLLGVLFIIVLRRTLVVEADLPFPESVAAAEIVKAGQGGQTGAAYVFGAMGLAGVWELFKNSNGIHLIADAAHRFVTFGRSTIEIAQERIDYTGGLLLATPAASPALMGVGFIVGMRVSAVLFAGAVLGWLVLVPLALFLNPAFGDSLSGDLATQIWSRQIRPLAVGTMIVAAFYTLYNLRESLVTGIGKALAKVGVVGPEGADRTQVDLNFKGVSVAIAVMAVATFGLYWYFAQSVAGALVLTAVMVVLGFLFAAVAGYLVGLIGSSNNPISGLTLSALLISAILMVVMGVTDVHGVAAVLGVAGVVCCAAGIAGDMMQDLKVGHILGGTPWRMQVGEMFGVVAAAAVLAFPLMALHRVYTIGSPELPAPQAGLMALMARGIVGGEMAWPLVIVGMFLALGLILIKSPSPMLVAVGMYLPFESTAAIFAGGLIRWLLEAQLSRRKTSSDEKVRAENMGTLLSSGFIAGESLMAVILAFLVIGEDFFPFLVRMRAAVTPSWEPSFLLSLLVYPGLVYLLVFLPLRKMRESGLPSLKAE
ncbi:MAG: oligopeptide transporter, OPT family [Acidobacteria bacterium]|jgi:putative OPT family oligopeptide transporter|nr:oligopeptide transporter, OPT family [Acidobacteriota bacterium]